MLCWNSCPGSNASRSLKAWRDDWSLEGALSVTREQAELFLELASQQLIECVLIEETDPDKDAEEFERLSRASHGDSRGWKLDREELHEGR
jgi:hypothetical protein